ncbi:MAG: glycosyl hydrolase 53 family protein, partial [Paludibacteraceae bacterium]|nr:glycosyl hydrolase 53 family protein [Paludibacteraceae bacterium]
TATTPEELQEIYRDLGSTEMYVRIATKRHVTADNLVDGKEDENANVHTFDQGIRLCRIAAALDMPINPEIMCAYTYMDMDRQQAPRFEEYPEVYALQNGKDWSELTIDEICTVLEAYGALVADSILSTGCTVNNWNLGNEANFGFAGISMGLKTAVDQKLEKASTISKYLAPVFATWWLKKHVWKHNAKAYAALKKGILSAYEKNSIDASNVKFSTHIATVVFPARCSASFFKYMAKNGYDMETAGISYYPSAPSMSLNRKKLLTKTVAKINKKCGVPVFIGEFSYPSGKMDGPFAGWNKKLRGYEKEQQGQADIYADVIRWGRHNGLAGIRYWAPDYEGWYAMSMFEFANKKGTAKTILQNHQEFVNQ